MTQKRSFAYDKQTTSFFILSQLIKLLVSHIVIDINNDSALFVPSTYHVFRTLEYCPYRYKNLITIFYRG